MSEEEDAPEITIDARRFAGVWANAIRVNGGQDEITMDFARLAQDFRGLLRIATIRGQRLHIRGEPLHRRLLVIESFHSDWTRCSE